MASRPIRTMFAVFLSLSGAASVRASQETIPNWSAPAVWKPGKAVKAATAGTTRTFSTLADISDPLPLIAVTPCRIVDTRGPSGPFGAPSLAAGTPRNFLLPAGPCPGIPTDVGAYSLNVTVTNTTGAGFLLIYPQGTAQPSVSTLNYVAGQTVANAAIVPASLVFTGGITVVAGVHGTDLIIDINGYYAWQLNPNEGMRIQANGAVVALEGINNSNIGVRGTSMTSTGVAGVSNSGSGVYGTTAGKSGQSGAAGVWGDSHDFFGVWGTSVNGDGVHGHTTAGTASGVAGFNDANGAGIFGFSNSGDGGFGSGATGLHGVSISGWGVYGHSTVGDGVHGDTIGNNTSGVAGLNGGGGFGVYGAGNAGTGVYGTSQSGDGVFGQAFAEGTAAIRAVGSDYCSGFFCSGGSEGLDVKGVARFDNSLYIAAELGVAGNKNFVAPHPTDPAKQIAFVSLEGPESGTYFRGTAKLLSGYAEVSVPESFRLVTSENGLTVVATPMAAAASLYCVSKSLDKIVFRGSEDVEFDYVVNGVRAGYDNYQAIQNNAFFVPKSASDRNLSRMPAEALRRLKANGILNDDGSLNEETAHKLGWDQRPGWNRAPQAPAVGTTSTTTPN